MQNKLSILKKNQAPLAVENDNGNYKCDYIATMSSFSK